MKATSNKNILGAKADFTESRGSGTLVKVMV